MSFCKYLFLESLWFIVREPELIELEVSTTGKYCLQGYKFKCTDELANMSFQFGFMP